MQAPKFYTLQLKGNSVKLQRKFLFQWCFSIFLQSTTFSAVYFLPSSSQNIHVQFPINLTQTYPLFCCFWWHFHELSNLACSFDKNGGSLCVDLDQTGFSSRTCALFSSVSVPLCVNSLGLPPLLPSSAPGRPLWSQDCGVVFPLPAKFSGCRSNCGAWAIYGQWGFMGINFHP